MESGKQKIFYGHIVITLLLMFGFGQLPAVGTITPLGMKLLGIFLGLIYAWSATSLLWPSLLGIVAVISTGMYSAKEFFKLSFGNDTVVLLIFMMVFAAMIDELGLIRFIAAWFTSRKFVAGKPWLFTFIFLVGAFIGAVFVNGFPVVLIFWSIFYKIAEQVGFKPYDKYCTLMLVGVVFAAMTVGASVMPYRLAGLLMISTVQAAAGTSVGFTQFILFSLPTGAALIGAYVLICKYILRPDVEPLKKLDGTLVSKEELCLDKKQKLAVLLLVVLIVLMVLPEVLPKTWALQQLLAQLGMGSITILLVVAGCLIKIDGQPIMNFGQMIAKGVSWDVAILFAIVLPLSSLLTNEATGITPFLVGTVSPLLGSLSPLVLIIVVTAVLTVLTNLANNAVLSVIFINILCPLSVAMGIDPVPIALSFLWFSQFAYMTPAASAPAAIIFGNTNWIKAKDVYKLWPLWVMLYVVALVLFVPYAQLIFG